MCELCGPRLPASLAAFPVHDGSGVLRVLDHDRGDDARERGPEAERQVFVARAFLDAFPKGADQLREYFRAGSVVRRR